MWIDSHCHLTHSKFGDLTPEQLVGRANEAGVKGMLTICCRISEEFDDILNTARQFENVWVSVGTHPHDAGMEPEKAFSAADIVALTKEERVIGIGESGLDYYYNNSTPEDQKVSFRKHIQACLEADLPLIVHARDADRDVIDIIREESAGANLRGVMHCFSSGAQMAEEALDLGFYLSFSGIVTFKKATELHEIAARTPLDRILIETDAPYLAPEPYRGKTNEPAYVIHTGSKVAGLHNISEESLASHSKENFFSLFNKAKLS